ncbi:MAG: CopD family protein [Actinomycetota bacterium]|nr:CopD family protein [Actinomycetota bacterium]
MPISQNKRPAKFSVLFGLIGLLLTFGFFGNLVNAAAAGTNQLSSSNPSPGQVVSVPPTQLQLVFRDPLANPEVATSMGLSLACNGTLVGLGVPQLGTDYKTVSVALTQIPSAGSCVVSWALPDRSLGSFQFTSAVAIQSTVPGATDGTGTPEAPTIIGETIEQQESGPRVGGILALLRIFEYLLMSALFGGLALIVTAWPEGPTYGVMIRYMRLAWISCVATMFFVLVLTTMREESQGFIASLNPFGWFGALNTGSGAILILRFVLICACGWVALFPYRINDPASQLIAGVIIVSMIATLGLSRLGQDVAIFSYVLGIIHAIAMAYWIGGLLLLSRVVLIGPGSSDLVSAMRAFSQHAVIAFGVTIFTGVLQIYLLDGSSIFTSGHGRLGVLKVIFVSVMIFITLVLKNFVLDRLKDGSRLSGSMAWRLRRAVTVELCFALVALIFTSWLVSTTPPKAKADIRVTTATYVFREELKNDRFHVVISLTPGVTGTNAMRIELIQPRRINNFAVKLIPQAIGFSGIQINVPLTRPGAAIVAGDGSFILNAPGIWNIEISGTTTTGDLTPLATTLAVTQAPDALTATTLPTATTAGG